MSDRETASTQVLASLASLAAQLRVFNRREGFFALGEIADGLDRVIDTLAAASPPASERKPVSRMVRPARLSLLGKPFVTAVAWLPEGTEQGERFEVLVYPVSNP